MTILGRIRQAVGAVKTEDQIAIEAEAIGEAMQPANRPSKRMIRHGNTARARRLRKQLARLDAAIAAERSRIDREGLS